MAAKTDQEIRDLLAATGKNMEAAERLPDAVRLVALRAQIQQLRNDLPADVGGSAAGSWSQLSNADQDTLASRLQQAADGADAAAALVDCNQSGSVMSRECAGNLEIIALLVLTALGLAFILIRIHELWPQAHGATGSQAELQVDLDLATEQYRDAKVAADSATKEVTELLKNQAAAPVAEMAEKSAARESQQEAKAPTQDTPAAVDSSGGLATSGANEQLAAAKSKARALRESQRGALTAVVMAQNKLVPRSEDILKMVILMGTLGGLIHLATSLSMFIGNRALRRSWIIYYLLMPFQSAALAPIVYLLLTAAVLAPNGGAGPGTTHEAINVTSVYAFAALTGLFAKQAVEKLADVFATIFTSVKAKDPMQ